MGDILRGTTALETLPGYSWFLIECSWEYVNDDAAVKKWKEVYNWFKNKPDKGEEYDNLRNEIADEGLIALNLIAKRRFVIAGQAKSNKPLQKLASMITLMTPIKVDVYAATNVFEFGNINKDDLGFDVDVPEGPIRF